MKRSCAILAAIFVLSILATAQAPPTPKPGPEQKKLDYFAGNWTCISDLKPGPMGPGGKTTLTEDTKWMDGGFFLVSHTNFDGGAMGKSTGISFLGYSSGEKKYTYDEFDSTGETVHALGTVDGENWTWLSDMKMGEQNGKGRFSEKILSPTSYAIKFEMSPDGASWTAVVEGKCTK